ncbi:MAG TPA: hypothetical protein VN426_10845 [Syntrophomonadaceae bacterium]|nr:hypothetical protein [Syntrophomonadaceae bacterium]
MSTNQVGLSAAMRHNILSLQNTSKQISQTQERLSTSKKVNTAMDNPTNYFAPLSFNAKTDRLSISPEAYEKFQQNADSLTLADTNEEAANMLALQTQQTLGIKSLSLSSQSAQNVMQLL